VVYKTKATNEFPAITWQKHEFIEYDDLTMVKLWKMIGNDAEGNTYYCNGVFLSPDDILEELYDIERASTSPA